MNATQLKRVCLAIVVCMLLEAIGVSMLSLRGLLPSIAFKFLILLLVAGGLLVLALAVKLVSVIASSVFHLLEKRHAYEERRIELQERRQQMRIDAEAHAVDMHLKLSRLFADANGNYPVLVPGRLDLLPSQIRGAGELLALPPGQVASGRVQVKEEKQALLDMPLPIAPSFREIERHITPERMLICYNERGPVWGTVDDLLSSNIVGKPGRGKTVLLFFFTAQFLKIGAQVIAFDPHGSMIEIADYISYEHEYEAMEQAVPKVQAMVNARLQAFKQWQLTKGEVPALLRKPVLFMVDELPAISLWEDENKPKNSILALIQRIILESRKTRMYVMLSGQAIPYDVLPTKARDNLSTHFVFECTKKQASMAGLEKEEIETLLPRLNGRDISMGKCVVSLARESKGFIGAISATDQDDLARIAGTVEGSIEPAYDREEEMPALNEPKVTPIFQKRERSKRVSYEEACNAWNEGYTSKRKMAAYLGITEWQAQAWCKQLSEEAQAIAEEEETEGEYAEAN